MAESSLPDFTPVSRKNTVAHGWTVAKQRGFIAALAATGSVRMATEAVGMSHCGVYKLRTAQGGESFARAWAFAVSLGAARVRDVLLDHAIHGVLETVVRGNKEVVHRRHFNHRTMIWVLQHHMPDRYPGGATTQRRGWGGRGEAIDEAAADAARERVKTQLDALAQRLRREDAKRLRDDYGTDPAKRAAYELRHGPVDWDALVSARGPRGDGAA